MGEEEIMQLIANGKMSALEQLYYSSYEKVYAFIFSMVKCRHTTEDLMHDTYMRIFAKAGSYQYGTNVNTWVITIAKNITYDYFRKMKNILPFDENPLEDGQTSQIDTYDNAIDHFDIEKALLKLSETDAQIAVLYAVCGYKHREIAQILSIPEGTVRRRYREAIKQLANALGGAVDG
jgi:RNA polymerase sigma-70 factor (ECF subfamily)